MHFSLPKMCTLVLTKSFALFLAKKITSVSPLLNGAEFTLSVAKNVALFETVHVLRTVKWRDWEGIEAAKQTMEFPAAPFFLVEISKKWIKLIPKTIGNRKRDCAWGCAWGISTTWENLQIEKHKSGRRSFRSPNLFVLFDLQIFSGGVYFFFFFFFFLPGKYNVLNFLIKQDKRRKSEEVEVVFIPQAQPHAQSLFLFPIVFSINIL